MSAEPSLPAGILKNGIDEAYLDGSVIGGEASADGSVIGDIMGKIKTRMNAGLEGQMVQNLRDKVGVDPEQLLMAQDSSAWSIGLFLMCVVFIAGGYAEAHIHVSMGETAPNEDTPLSPLASLDVNAQREGMRKPLIMVVLAEMISLVLSLGYTPLTLSLPAVALHQVSRVIGTAMKGRPIGGRTMRIGILGIVLGFLMTSLFGFHQTLEPHGWEKIVTAMWSSMFQFWSILCFTVVAFSLIIAYVSPVRSGAAGLHPLNDNMGMESSNIVMSIAETMRINCLIYLLSIPVSWSTKRYAFSAICGILAGFFVLIAQQVTLTLSVAPHLSSLLGFQTFALAFICGLYTLICIIVFNKALRTFDSSKFLPSAMCWCISIGTINELVLQMICFEERAIALIRLVFYCVGLILVCGGLICMGQADVRQQLEDLQFLASEVSRLGVVIEETFNEASTQPEVTLTHQSRQDSVVELSQTARDPDLAPLYKMEGDGFKDMSWLESGHTDELSIGQSSIEDDREGRAAISAAFDMGGNNNYVQTILSDLRMTEGT